MNPTCVRLGTLQRRLWRRHLAAIRQHVGDPPKALRQYERRYRQDIQGPLLPVRRSEVLAALSRADVTLVGDYHTFLPCQRTCLEVLSWLASSSSQVILFVELALGRDQRHIDGYLAGNLDEPALLRGLNYRSTWGFPWDGYRPLFHYAKANGIPIVGLNGPGDTRGATLLERDRFAARVLVRTLRRHPGSRLLALVGDMHLADPHLPAQLRLQDPELRIARVFQDTEDLYWRTAASRPTFEATQLDQDKYCIFNGTPWQKLESYLRWLECDAVGALEAVVLDPTDAVLEMATTVARFLGLTFTPEDSRTVFYPSELTDLPVPGLMPMVAASVPAEIVLPPDSDRLILANADLASAAEAATELLLDQHAPIRNEDLGDTVDAFLRRLYRHALAYLGSKLLVPARRPEPPERLAPSVQRLLDAYARAIPAALARAELTLPAMAAAIVDDRRLGFGVTRGIGRALGEQLHRGFIDGRWSQPELRRLFRRIPSGDELTQLLTEFELRGRPPFVPTELDAVALTNAS